MIPFFSSRSGSDRGTASQAPQAPLRPAPPIAKRLNRNALTVAAVIMGMTVLTAIVLLKPSEKGSIGSAARPATDEAPPPPSRPVFLDEPVRAPLRLGDTARGLDQPSGPPSVQSAPDAYAHRARDVDPYATPDALPYAAPPVAPSAEAVSPRVGAYRAALASPAIVSGTAPTSGSGLGAEASPPVNEEQRLIALGDSIMRAAVGQGTPGIKPGAGDVAQAGGLATRPSALSQHRAFLDESGDARGATVIVQLEPASSPFTLHAGTLIPGILVTGINSDLPGDIVGQVSRDVYDSRTQRILLIPRGSRLIGTYDNQVGAGQGRLLIAWTRLILPDGRSMRLPGLALKDAAGQTGARDKVDNHWRRVFGNALLLSAISAGVQLSQPQQSNVLTPPSAGQVAAGALGQELSNVALEILRRGMDVPPTITIRAGQPFNVFLNGDLVVVGPFEERPQDAR